MINASTIFASIQIEFTNKDSEKGNFFILQLKIEGFDEFEKVLKFFLLED